jgi:hypothetical protein
MSRVSSALIVGGCTPGGGGGTGMVPVLSIGGYPGGGGATDVGGNAGIVAVMSLLGG